MWWGHPVLLLLLLLGVLLLLIRPSNVVCNTFGTENNVSIVGAGKPAHLPNRTPAELFGDVDHPQSRAYGLVTRSEPRL
jgi:hypothetical protein